MSLSPQRRRRTPHADNPSLASDCQKLATVNPSTIPALHSNAPRTTPNKSEQT